MKNIHEFKPLPLATAIALATGSLTATATEVDELTRVSEPESTVSAGMGYNSEDLTTLGRYNGRNEDRFYPLLNFDINQRDDATGTWTRMSGNNLGLTSRDVRFEQNRQGKWKYFIEYNQLEAFSPYIYRTDLTGIGTNSQAVGGTTRDLHFSQERKNVKIGMGRHFSDELNLTVSFRQENKEGDRPWGIGDFSSGRDFMVEPIDYRTRELEATLDYTTEKLQLRGGYLLSLFDNPDEFVELDEDGDSTIDYTTATPPDNESHSLYLAGGYTITDTTRATFKVSKILDLQDEDFFVVNGKTPSRTSLDGEIDTTRIDLGIVSRVMPKLTLKARLRYDDRDDETPQDILFDKGGTDYTNQLTSRTITTGTLDATYRLERGFTLTGGIEREEFERIVTDVPNMAKREDTDETTLKIGARKTLTDSLSGTVRLSVSERDGSELIPGAEAPDIFVKPIQWSDRDREELRLTLDWYASEALSLQLITEASQDDYSGAPQGPEEGSSRLLSLDAGYRLNDEWALNAWASTNRKKLKLTTDDWATDIEDQGIAFGFGVKGEPTFETKVGLKLQVSRDTSETPLANLDGSPATDLPTIEYRQASLSFYGEYTLTEQQSLRLDYRYDRIKNDDWTWDSYTEYPSTTVIQPDQESAHFVGLTYNYRYW